MYSSQVTIKREEGLHARPATFFIQKANQFDCSIWVETDSRKVNAKSLLGVLSLGIMQGSSINIIASGSDEEDAVNALVALVESDFVE
ncbi:MAG: HPr family phosphocarrier protein [Clostridia bacterium]|nr:HPr family phosphocarrier protein [Clostridia bacterium]